MSDLEKCAYCGAMPVESVKMVNGFKSRWRSLSCPNGHMKTRFWYGSEKRHWNELSLSYQRTIERARNIPLALTYTSGTTCTEVTP